MRSGATVVWFRDDLRVADNPALSAAVDRGAAVVAVYILDEVSPGFRPLGGATKWWLHESLASLAEDLAELNIPLIFRRGAAGKVLHDVVTESTARAVTWNRRYRAAEIAIDAELKARLRSDGVEVESFQASLLFEPWEVSTSQGTPYSVFTPFWRACQNGLEPRHPMPVPSPIDKTVSASAVEVACDSLDSWALQPSDPDWAQGLRDTWVPGEESAQLRLSAFLTDDLDAYAEGRNTPSDPVTSRLSPHVRFGELSPHQIWHEVARVRSGLTPAGANSAARFLTELGWREFAWHVLFHFPKLAERSWRAEYDAFPWPDLDRRALAAWQTGRTGVPLVDAGMRELWHTGTMHNRVRMVVASFLTKNLLIDWREGEEWFWDTLVDADSASNPFNWQWVAGSGADAAPYFRVFNPELQATKFDPKATYIRQHVPEWGTDEYPEPIVDLGESRRAALAAHKSLKQRTQEGTRS
ncbi:MAG: deoxyribodipyrimidine photo-lyase [Terrimesophilobacter sp.]